jgi:hypothetical protein
VKTTRVGGRVCARACVPSSDLELRKKGVCQSKKNGWRRHFPKGRACLPKGRD